MRDRVAMILEKTGDVLGYGAAAIIMLLAIPVIYSAVARDAGHPTTWEFEYTLYALITGAFLGNAQALKHGNHFRVRVLLSSLPQARRFFDALAWLATLLFGLVITVAGYVFAAYSYTNHIRAPSLLDTPLYIPQAVIPIGGLALMTQSLAHLLKGASSDADTPE